jgi:hypothetical protein
MVAMLVGMLLISVAVPMAASARLQAQAAKASDPRPVITYTVAATPTRSTDKLALIAIVKYATSVSFVYQEKVHRASYTGKSTGAPVAGANGPIWTWKSNQVFVSRRCYSYRIIARNQSGTSQKTIKAGPTGQFPCVPGL